MKFSHMFSFFSYERQVTLKKKKPSTRLGYLILAPKDIYMTRETSKNNHNNNEGLVL